MIRADNLSAAYGIHHVSLDFDQPQLVALVGPNGSGKTTLLRAMARLLPVTGTLLVTPRIAYLAQRPEFQSTMSVRNVVELGRAPYRSRLGKLSKAGKAAVSKAMAVTDVQDFADRPIGTLSGGQQARVALARALAVEADIVLADEPTASLDAAQALDVLERLKRESRTTLVIAAIHDLALAAHFADRVIVMNKGRVEADGGQEVLDGEVLAMVFGITPPPGGWRIPERTAKRGS